MKKINKNLLAIMIILSCSITVANVINITSQDDLNTLIHNNKVIVKYYAPWCGACKFTNEPYEELSNELPHIVFAKANVDIMSQAFLKKEGIEGIPTFKYLDNGTEKNSIVGIESMQNFKETVKDNVKKAFGEIEKKNKQTQSNGPLSGIKKFFMALVKKVADFIKFIITQIKSLFGK
jgi:thiol-disulfide isomerase/thioredoxin